MKNYRIVCIFIATIILGAGSAACAGEIEEGSIDVVINDNFYGSVSPTIDLENTNITLALDIGSSVWPSITRPSAEPVVWPE